MERVVCPRDVLMCTVLDAKQEEGRLLVFDQRSGILPGAGSL
jgi:hypothetical protein